MRNHNVSLLITTTLFLFVSTFSFAQVKVNVEIEGEGVVCVREKSFNGVGLHEVDVEKGTELHFRIKPGKQFYLDSLSIYKFGEDVQVQVSRDDIYAERDDTLHYYTRLSTEGNVFHFVFREVLPWDGVGLNPYKSRDKSYSHIYIDRENWLHLVILPRQACKMT